MTLKPILFLSMLFHLYPCHKIIADIKCFVECLIFKISLIVLYAVIYFILLVPLFL